MTSVNGHLGFELFRFGDARVLRSVRREDPVLYKSVERAEWDSDSQFLRERSGKPALFPDMPTAKEV